MMASVAEPPIACSGVVAVGASAGGVPALRALVAGLSPTIPAAVVVVLHIAPNAPSALTAILGRAGTLPTSTAADDAELRAGHLYVAPADRHVLVDSGRLTLSAAAAERGHRPAIDPLLRSAAAAYGARAIGIVLSGTGTDGTAGLAAIAERGGAVFVQDPAEARYPAMPRSALGQVPAVVALPIAGLVVEVDRLLGRGTPGPVGSDATH